MQQTAETRGAPVITAPSRALVGRPIGPQVICARGPSRSGKTSVCERIVSGLGESGLRVAYLKRTHHLLDLPEKSSARVWENGPALMVLRATDRLQVTLGAGAGTAAELLQQVPADIDVVLLETHEQEPYPTILSDALSPDEGEMVFASWNLADFFCSELQLILEIDGAVHNNPEQQTRDRERTLFLQGLGCEVVRISNSQAQSEPGTSTRPGTGTRSSPSARSCCRSSS